MAKRGIWLSVSKVGSEEKRSKPPTAGAHGTNSTKGPSCEPDIWKEEESAKMIWYLVIVGHSWFEKRTPNPVVLSSPPFKWHSSANSTLFLDKPMWRVVELGPWRWALRKRLKLGLPLASGAAVSGRRLVVVNHVARGNSTPGVDGWWILDCEWYIIFGGSHAHNIYIYILIYIYMYIEITYMHVYVYIYGQKHNLHEYNHQSSGQQSRSTNGHTRPTVPWCTHQFSCSSVIIVIYIPLSSIVTQVVVYWYSPTIYYLIIFHYHTNIVT